MELVDRRLEARRCERLREPVVQSREQVSFGEVDVGWMVDRVREGVLLQVAAAIVGLVVVPLTLHTPIAHAAEQQTAQGVRVARAVALAESCGPFPWQQGDLTPPASPGGGLPLGRKLPSSQASGQPRLSVTLGKAGKNTERMTITNNGPDDVYNLDFELADDREGTREWREDSFPVPKLPPGKSVSAARYLTLASGTPAYFTVILTGKTADGVEIRQEEFVSGR